RVEGVGVYPGGVDHGTRAQPQERAGELVPEYGTVGGDLLRRAASEDACPFSGCGAWQTHHETGVVDELTVEGQDPPEQALPVHPRQESKGLSSVERAGAGKHVVGGAYGPAQQVADTRSAAYEQRAKCARVPVDRDDHGQRPY